MDNSTSQSSNAKWDGQWLVDPPTRVWINERMFWLAGAFGIDRMLQARVILPNHEFFPESYNGKPEDVEPLLCRVCEFMHVDRNRIQLNFYSEGDAESPVLGRRSSAGMYSNEEGQTTVWIEAGTLRDPLTVVSTLAHEVGHVLLLGDERLTADVEDHEPLTDLLTVFLGLGVINANAVIRETCEDRGMSSAWSISRLGYMSMPMFGYALAVFAWCRGESKPAWASELRADVRQAFRQGLKSLTARGTEDRSLAVLVPDRRLADIPSCLPTMLNQRSDNRDSAELEEDDDDDERDADESEQAGVEDDAVYYGGPQSLALVLGTDGFYWIPVKCEQCRRRQQLPLFYANGLGVCRCGHHFDVPAVEVGEAQWFADGQARHSAAEANRKQMKLDTRWKLWSRTCFVSLIASLSIGGIVHWAAGWMVAIFIAIILTHQYFGLLDDERRAKMPLEPRPADC